jgi:hypothetical protein
MINISRKFRILLKILIINILKINENLTLAVLTQGNLAAFKIHLPILSVKS